MKPCHIKNKSYLLKNLSLGLLIAFSSTFSNANNEKALNSIANTGNIQTTEGVVEIFKKVNIPSDKRAIRYFFSYTCPYSRKFDTIMYKWGATLPKPLVYARVPMITDDEGSYFGAIAYYTVAAIAPEKLNNYQEEVYAQIQDRNKSNLAFETYAEAAFRVGIDIKRFSKEILTIKMHNYAATASILGAKYQVSATPSIGIGGTYSFSSELVNPDTGNLVQLSNAMVSKFISEVGLSKK